VSEGARSLYRLKTCASSPQPRPLDRKTVARASSPCSTGKMPVLPDLGRGGGEGSLRGGGGICDTPVLPLTNLFLLATVHGDPAGYARAWRFLEYLLPEIITVEISRFSVRYREGAAKGWQRRLAAALKELPPGAETHLAVARVAAQVGLPFEYRAARDWGRAHGVPVKFLDSGALSRRHLPRYDQELLSRENLALLLETSASLSLAEFVFGEFQRARLAMAGKIKPRLVPLSGESGRREQLWARRLRRLADGNQRLVHLGGWEHLVPWPDGGGLPHLLSDLNPCVLLLEEADDLVRPADGN